LHYRSSTVQSRLTIFEQVLRHFFPLINHKTLFKKHLDIKKSNKLSHIFWNSDITFKKISQPHWIFIEKNAWFGWLRVGSIESHDNDKNNEKNRLHLHLFVLDIIKILILFFYEINVYVRIYLYTWFLHSYFIIYCECSFVFPLVITIINWTLRFLKLKKGHSK